VDTLGLFQRTESMPYFLWALGDDICRSSAEAAIRRLGNNARPFLVDAACQPNPSQEEENPSSLQRRRWVLRILSDLKALPQDWERLKEAINEDDPEIVITTARMGLEVAPTSDRLHAVHRLIEMLPRVDWFLRGDARMALLDHFDVSREAIEDEIARRTAVSARDCVFDVVLRLLISIRTQALDPELKRH
jgi:hypothetical protein